MSIRNKVTLIGRTGKDVENFQFENGQKSTVSLATTEYYTNSQGVKTETTEWHNLVAYGKIAEIMQKYVEKGKEIAIEGKITIGVLHKVSNGFRFYTPLEGATMINGRYITTGKVQSVNGLTWFDLDLGAFDLAGQAGMTGNGALSDYFLWAGSDYTNRSSAPFGVTKDGMLVFRNSIGQIIFELGLQNGEVVFNIYNDNGVRVATIGSQGIIFTGYIAESYTETSFRKLITNDWDNTVIKTEIQNQIQKVATAVGNPPTNPPWIQFDISIIENYTAYLYNEGRNFESADNAQYAGYHISANKFDDFVPNGIYVADITQVVIVGNFMGSNRGYTFIYFAEVHKMVNGVIVDSMVVEVTKKVTSQGDWSMV